MHGRSRRDLAISIGWGLATIICQFKNSLPLGPGPILLCDDFTHSKVRLHLQPCLFLVSPLVAPTPLNPAKVTRAIGMALRPRTDSLARPL